VKIKKFLNLNYSNYKKSNCHIFFPKNNQDIFKIIDFAKKHKKKILPIGSGLSWYDTIFNSNNIIIDLNNYKKKFVFDKDKGELLISSQFRIIDIIHKLNKYGWSLYAIPGGGEVTIGGCIGNDVHGKDSFKHGNFSNNIIELELVLPNKKIIKCSEKKNKIFFRSVCGGLGLIGIVTEVKFKLKPIAKFYHSITIPCNNYKELIRNLYEDNDKYDYINGWVDIYGRNQNLGKSIIFKSKRIYKKNLKNDNINTSNFFNVIQKYIFGLCVKNNLTKYINYFIFLLFKSKKENINTYKDISFPLSSYGVDIKEMINPYSFFEVQVLIKKENIKKDLKNFILCCQKLNLLGFVIGIKMHKKNNNYISFSDDGISININQIFNAGTDYSKELNKIRKLHDYVIKKNHKIYICKDTLLDKIKIKKNYRKYKNFLGVKKKYDKDNLLFSDFLKRVS
jgi:decaprenylphospho-beta-D-ribofuranose 2-oxidase